MFTAGKTTNNQTENVFTRHKLNPSSNAITFSKQLYHIMIRWHVMRYRNAANLDGR